MLKTFVIRYVVLAIIVDTQLVLLITIGKHKSSYSSHWLAEFYAATGSLALLESSSTTTDACCSI